MLHPRKLGRKNPGSSYLACLQPKLRRAKSGAEGGSCSWVQMEGIQAAGMILAAPATATAGRVA